MFANTSMTARKTLKAVAIAAVAIGALGLTACSPPTNNVEAVPLAESTPNLFTPASTPASVNAYPAIGSTVGVTGAGDELACDPVLETVPLSSGTMEYNGVIIDYGFDFKATGSPGEVWAVELEITGELTGVRSAIVRSDDSYWSNSANTSYSYPVHDQAVNWTPEMNSGLVVFRTVDFNGPNEISGIELCVDLAG